MIFPPPITHVKVHMVYSQSRKKKKRKKEKANVCGNCFAVAIIIIMTYELYCSKTILISIIILLLQV